MFHKIYACNQKSEKAQAAGASFVDLSLLSRRIVQLLRASLSCSPVGRALKAQIPLCTICIISALHLQHQAQANSHE